MDLLSLAYTELNNSKIIVYSFKISIYLSTFSKKVNLMHGKKRVYDSRLKKDKLVHHYIICDRYKNGLKVYFKISREKNGVSGLAELYRVPNSSRVDQSIILYS